MLTEIEYEKSGESFGYTTRTARLQMNGEKRAVLIEVGIRDETRLQVLLSKALSAMSDLEWEIENMTEDDVSKFLEELSKQGLTKIESVP